MGMSSARLWLRTLIAEPRPSLCLHSSQVPSGIGVNIQVSVQVALISLRPVSKGGSSKLAVPNKKVAEGGNGISCWLTPPSPNALPQTMSWLVVPLLVVTVPGTAPKASRLYWLDDGRIWNVILSHRGSPAPKAD